MIAHLLVGRAYAHAGCIQVDDDFGHAAVFRTEQHDEVGNRRIGDEALSAVDDIATVAAVGEGLDRLDVEVRARIRLGGREAADLVTGEQRLEVAPLQLG
jgi:hypothetical protein